MTIGRLTLDLERRDAAIDGRFLALKPREFALLSVLGAEPGRAFSRKELLAIAWPDAERLESDRTIDVHISRLRRKLGVIGGAMLQSTHGHGYRLAADGLPTPAQSGHAQPWFVVRSASGIVHGASGDCTNAERAVRSWCGRDVVSVASSPPSGEVTDELTCRRCLAIARAAADVRERMRTRGVYSASRHMPDEFLELHRPKAGSRQELHLAAVRVADQTRSVVRYRWDRRLFIVEPSSPPAAPNTGGIGEPRATTIARLLDSAFVAELAASRACARHHARFVAAVAARADDLAASKGGDRRLRILAASICGGLSPTRLAEQYGVSTTRIREIIANGKRELARADLDAAACAACRRISTNGDL